MVSIPACHVGDRGSIPPWRQFINILTSSPRWYCGKQTRLSRRRPGLNSLLEEIFNILTLNITIQAYTIFMLPMQVIIF